MTERCVYRYPAGHFCKRWVETGKRFCHDHDPDRDDLPKRTKADHLHPLLRLSTPEDLFDAVREAINAARLGRISPGQAYAMGYLADVWLRLHKAIGCGLRDKALHRQFLPDIVAEESALQEDFENTSVPPPTPRQVGPSIPALPPESLAETVLQVVTPPLKLEENSSASASPGKDSGDALFHSLLPPPLQRNPK